MNKTEAELLGMHAGDGTLYRTNSGTLVWELRGGRDEINYYTSVVTPFLHSVFDIPILPKHRSGGKNGSFGIQTSHKKVTKFFSQFFPIGEKSSRVTVPPEVFHGPSAVQSAFLRGLFDTDGCLRFDKNHTARKYYPKIELTTLSPELIIAVGTILRQFNIGFYTWTDRGTQRICIPGRKNLQIWLHCISFHNPKHLNKLGKGNVHHAGVAQPGTARMLEGFF